VICRLTAAGSEFLQEITIKSAADLKLPMVAVTILTKKGYFRQEIDRDGRQVEIPEEWDVNRFMTPLQEKISIDIEGRNVHIASWLYIVESATGGKVPIIFLDTDIPDNKSER